MDMRSSIPSEMTAPTPSLESLAFSKLVLSVIATTCYAVGFYPPNLKSPPEEKKRLDPPTTWERFVDLITNSAMALIIILGILEFPLLLSASGLLSSTSSGSLHSTASFLKIDTLHLTLLDHLSISILLFGAFMRRYAIHTLGQSFTYTIKITKSHKLTTWGPYTWVRHPSYTGSYSLYFGTVATQPRIVALVFRLNPAEWSSVGNVEVSSMWLDVYKFLIGATFAMWFIIWTTSFVPIHQRTYLEDRLLEKTFGEEYRVWRKKTPCRYIPGIF